MTPGDQINLKDGRKASVTRIGMGDFIGDPFPIYYVVIGTTETGFLMSDELRKK